MRRSVFPPSRFLGAVPLFSKRKKGATATHRLQQLDVLGARQIGLGGTRIIIGRLLLRLSKRSNFFCHTSICVLFQIGNSEN